MKWIDINGLPIYPSKKVKILRNTMVFKRSSTKKYWMIERRYRTVSVKVQELISDLPLHGRAKIDVKEGKFVVWLGGDGHQRAALASETVITGLSGLERAILKAQRAI
jgi:hypothetical protein